MSTDSAENPDGRHEGRPSSAGNGPLSENPEGPGPATSNIEPAQTRNSRRVAASLVLRWLQSGDFPDRLVDAVEQDHAFVMEVVLGVVRNQRALQWIVSQFVPNPPPPAPAACLHVGLYQIFFMDSVAEYAAVNETVEATKTLNRGGTALVNAVLRRALREKQSVRARFRNQPLAVRESHPDLLVQRWTQALGAEKAERLCRWNNTRPQATLRPNLRRTSLAELQRRFQEAGIEALPHPFLPEEFLLLPGGVRVEQLPGYATGDFSVQDPSTASIVRLLAPRPGETLLDACAAPGGKTALLSECTGDSGCVVATDLREDRLQQLRENVARLQMPAVRVLQADAARRQSLQAALTQAGLPAQPFDGILLDVPCTNSGVLRRRPDARWRFSEERLTKLLAIQRALLDNVAGVLKPGGRLAYGTCSLEPEENELQVQSWLAAHPEFECRQSVRLFPPDTATDGSYAAVLQHRG